MEHVETKYLPISPKHAPREITIKLTNVELNTIVAAFGTSSETGRTRSAKDDGIEILTRTDKEDRPHDLYMELLKLSDAKGVI